MTAEIEVIEFKNDLPVKVPQYVKEIETLTAKSKDLVLTDVNDKEQLKAIAVARKELKGMRVGVEKYMKSVRDGANVFSKAVIAKEKEIVALIEPEETRLEAEEAKYTAEQERLAEIKRKEEEALFNGRVAGLAKMGFILRENGYELQGCVITSTEIRLMGPADWTRLIATDIKTAWDKEQARIAEEVRIQEERIAEEKRLREENERMRKEEDERRANERKELEEAQAKLKLEQEAQRKREEEIKQKEAELQAIEDKSLAEVKQKSEAERKAKELEQMKKEAEEQARLKAIREKEEADAAKALAEKKAAEKEARKPDKKKLLDYADTLETLANSVPEVKQPQMKHYANGIRISVQEVVTRIRKEVGEL